MADYESPIVAGRAVLSPRASSLLSESGAMAARAFLLGDGGGRVALPLTGGSVTLDSGSTVRRTATLTVLGAWSDDPHSRLTPYGARVLVQRGIRVAPDSIEWVTVMVGRIVEVGQDSEDNDAEMTLSVKDDMAAVAANRFDATTTTDTAKTVVDNITAYARRSLAAVEVVDLTGDTSLSGKIDVQQDPAGGIDKLATAISAEAYMGRDGTLVIRPQPTLDDTPSWELSVGQRGNVIAVSRKRTADGVYNRVLARGQDNSSTTAPKPPVPYGEATIDNLTDPLRYGGPYGKVTRFYTSGLLKTDEQCAAAARSILEKARGANVDFAFTALVNPAIDPGDVIWSVLSDGKRRVHIVDSVTIPLSPNDTQSMGVRSLELPDEQDNTTTDDVDESAA